MYILKEKTSIPTIRSCAKINQTVHIFSRDGDLDSLLLNLFHYLSRITYYISLIVLSTLRGKVSRFIARLSRAMKDYFHVTDELSSSINDHTRDLTIMLIYSFTRVISDNSERYIAAN